MSKTWTRELLEEAVEMVKSKTKQVFRVTLSADI